MMPMPNPMSDYISSARKNLEQLGYKRYTVGISHTLKKAFQAGKSIDAAVSEIQGIFMPNGFLMPGCYYKPEGDGTFVKGDSMHQKETLETSDAEPPVDPVESPVTPVKPPVDPGATMFDTYLAVKRSLADKLKSVLKIMATCDTLDVNPECNSNMVKSQISTVANHQWTYNEGHETIFCRHMTFEHRHQDTQTIVKVPVRYLGMSEEEIWADNEASAIKALEEKKASYEKKRSGMLKPIDAKISEVDKQIKMLKAHKIGDQNG